MNFRLKNSKSSFKKTGFESSNFLRDKTVRKQSKFNFIDSEDDCSIIEKDTSDRIFSSLKSKDAVSNQNNANKQLFTLNTDKLIHTNGIYKTAEEKYKLLDSLDKNYIANFDTFGINQPNFVGTCLDMCPEKERYYKEITNNVSIFERDDDHKFNYKKAVKKYERCVVENSVPLPYELRSTEVLDLTMNYLISHIFDVDFAKISWDQWYLFLGTRTRPILKEITQQTLCNITVVKIIETIARFHIFSGARFCEESKDLFDKKYNDTNLKNCLQSLKDLYKDMKMNSCQNEAEFRGYMIILNIENKASLYEMSDFILKSKEVQFALEIYEAFKVHNYVRFFRLFQTADFITSCLLHRLIVKARIDALNVINKAYVVNKSGENQVPLKYFYKTFGFDNMEHTRDFFKEIGFSFTTDMINSAAIILNGSTMSINNENFAKRSLKLVESKQANQRLSTLLSRNGEIFYDHELPPCKMISFNDKDQYIGSLSFNSENSNKECRISNIDYDLNVSKTKSENNVLENHSIVEVKISKEQNVQYIQNQNIQESVGLFNKITSLNKLKSDDSYVNIFQNRPIIYNQDESLPSNQIIKVSNSNKVSFYIPQYKSSVSSKSSQSDDNCEIITEEDNIYIEIISNDFFDELTEEICTETFKMGELRVINSEKILTDIVREITNEIVQDTSHSIIKSYRESISIGFANDIIYEVSEEISQVLKELLQKQILGINKHTFTLKSKYFNKLRTFTSCRIKDRKSMIKLPATPRMTDDFTICEEFRGKVRKICTDVPISSDVYYLRHPVMARLSQITPLKEHLPRKFVKKNMLVQTNISYADIKIIKVNLFIREFIEAKFIKILDSQLNILELVQQADPSPEKIITDYNNIIDQIDIIVQPYTNISVSKLMKLPLIKLDISSVTNWMQYIDEIFTQLNITDNYRNELFQDVNWTLNKLKVNKEINYYHIRLFPWIKLIKCAVLNKLIFNDQNFGHLEMQIDVTILLGSRNTLQLENTFNNISIAKCLKEANKCSQRPYINKPDHQNKPIPRRISSFNDLLKKLSELEKNLNECKE